MAERRRRSSDDPFFSPGYNISLNDTLTYIYIEETAADEENSCSVNGDECVGDNSPPTVVFPCSMPGCNEIFDSIGECDEHYETSHVFECSECNAVLPNNHLLDLHLQETHDSYFATALERSMASYQCLVLTCPEVFQTDAERNAHLRNRHGYPKWFRFHPKSKQGRGMVERKEEESCNMQIIEKKRIRWMEKHNGKAKKNNTTDANSRLDEIKECGSMGDGNPNNDEIMSSDNIIYTNTPPVDHIKKLKLEKKKIERRDRQMKKRATIPCKFFSTKGGCWRGEKCMFLHDSSNRDSSSPSIHDVNGDEDNNMNVDPLIGDLVKHMEQKVQVTVPDKIVFGKRCNRRGRATRK